LPVDALKDLLLVAIVVGFISGLLRSLRGE
jgi:hypothetical protein